jgi:hypothetical protein
MVRIPPLRRFLQNAVGADYFSTMRIPVLAGPEFTAMDTTEAVRIVIVSESAALTITTAVPRTQ